MDTSIQDAPLKKNCMPRLGLCFLLAFPVALGFAVLRIHTTVRITSEFGAGVTLLGNAGIYKSVAVREPGFSAITIKTPDGAPLLLSELPEDLAAKYDWLVLKSDQRLFRKGKETPAANIKGRMYSWNPISGPHFQFDGRGQLTEAYFAGNVEFSIHGSKFVTLPADMGQVELVVGSPASRVRTLGAAGAEPP